MQAKVLPKVLSRLRLPVICAPMFTVSYPNLVKAQCLAGLVGSFPALNAREAAQLPEWLTDIKHTLAEHQAQFPEANIGPIAINQIMHASNARLEQDIRVCVEHQVPIFITSLQAPNKEMIDAVHQYGGIVLHDVISVRHAEKALEAGVDGLILVATGAGGHAGTLSPFALVGEIRRFYDGILALSGAIANGSSILAAQAMGADFAYIGTRFIATQEAEASAAYKQNLVDARASDIIYSNYFTGVQGNYLKQSILNCGLDPANLPTADKNVLDFQKRNSGKAWKDIWGAGQGVAVINDIPTVSEVVQRLEVEYWAAKKRLCLSNPT